MNDKKSVPVFLTGNGGQSSHDMSVEDAQRLETVLDNGSNQRTFKFRDEQSRARVTVVLDKLFVMEVKD